MWRWMYIYVSIRFYYEKYTQQPLHHIQKYTTKFILVGFLYSPQSSIIIFNTLSEFPPSWTFTSFKACLLCYWNIDSSFPVPTLFWSQWWSQHRVRAWAGFGQEIMRTGKSFYISNIMWLYIVNQIYSNLSTWLWSDNKSNKRDAKRER